MSKRIQVISPDGKLGSIPEDRLDAAIQHGGYKLADEPVTSDIPTAVIDFVDVISPEGKKGKIPRANLEAALQNEYKLYEQPQGDSWPELIGKSALQGLNSIADLPQIAGQYIIESTNPEHGLLGKLRQAKNLITGQEHVPLKGVGDYLPDVEVPMASSLINQGIEGVTGWDPTPKPSDGLQRVASHAAEFMVPLSWMGKLNKGANMLKNAKAGAAIGATSGLLQEGGIDPLAADITASVINPLAPAAAKTLLHKFSPASRQAKTEQKLAAALTQQIGEDNVPKALENIQKYKQQKKPINVQLTTPEIVQDAGLSKLYRANSNFSSIPAQFEANDLKLREALEKMGTVGLDESVKGELLREPFIERLARKKQRRTNLTQPLYEELENLQGGIDPEAARALLKNEIAVSSPGQKGPLERYYKGLQRNDANPADLKKIEEKQKILSQIEQVYQGSSPAARELYKAPFLEEINQLQSSINPRPIQIENTIQELGDKVNSYARAGETNASRRYGKIKKAYEEDLSKSPVGLKHREEYKRLSKPVNEIEGSNILNKLTQPNRDVTKLDAFAVPNEKIPQAILSADLENTKRLINKAKGDKDLLQLIRGTYIDDLLQKSTLNSGNFSYNKAKNLLEGKNKEKIKVIFNNAERKKLEQFKDILDRRAKLESKGNVGGSNTHQKLLVENDFNKSLGFFTNLAKKGLSKATGYNAADLIVNTGKDLWNSTKNRGYNNMLEQVLVDPNAFKRLMTNPTTYQPLGFNHFYNPTNPLLTSIMLNERRD